MAEAGDRLQELFQNAVEESPEARERLLASLAAEDPALAEELRELLEADRAAEQFTGWNAPAVPKPGRAETPASCIGEIVGAYRLVDLIGSGGMGAVYRAARVDAQTADFDMIVAIKRIAMQFHDPEIVARFRAERRILAQLEHPNIARLIDGGADAAGLPYLVMEFVDGARPLDYCREHRLTIRQRLDLFRQICAAVHYAHQHMVIHRDIKPANILVTSDGVPKLLDFGIAKVFTPDPTTVTDMTAPIMTPRYSSPEQVRGEPVTTASDIYSLGVILYELLTGKSPYEDSPPHQLIAAVCEKEPEPPGTHVRELRGDLDNIVLKALRKKPAERYSSVSEFSDDILRYLEGRPVLACGDAPLYIAAKFIGRHRTATAAALLLLVTLVASLVLIARARARADQRFNQVRALAHSLMYDYADAIGRLPGSTPVRARLVQDSLTYLDNLSKQADTPDLQREIVEAYIRVSGIQGNAYQSNLGDEAGALSTARRGVSAAEKLLKEDSSSAALMAASEAYSVEASLLYSADKLQDADRDYQRAVSLRESAAKMQPDDVSNTIALSADLRHIGELYGAYGNQNLGKTAESAKYFQHSAELVGQLGAKHPKDVQVAQARYDALLSLSASEHAEGLRDAAHRDLLEASSEIGKVAAASPNDVDSNAEVANVEARIGLGLMDDRKPQEALPHFVRSAEILERFSAADPKNAVLRRGLSVVEAQRAVALADSGDTKAAVEHHRKSIDLSEALTLQSPGDVEYRSDLAIGERRLSDTLLKSGDASGALDQATAARKILCDPTRKSNDAYLDANCDRTLVTAGNALLRLNKTAEAVDSWRQAEQIAQRRSVAEPVNAVYRSDLARAQAALAAGLAHAGQHPEASAMYKSAIENWSKLRNAKALSAEDAYRASVATHDLAAIAAR